MGKIVWSCVGSLAFKTELSDSSCQILMIWRFINFEITLLLPFHQGVGIISM